MEEEWGTNSRLASTAWSGSCLGRQCLVRALKYHSFTHSRYIETQDFGTASSAAVVDKERNGSGGGKHPIERERLTSRLSSLIFSPKKCPQFRNLLFSLLNDRGNSRKAESFTKRTYISVPLEGKN